MNLLTKNLLPRQLSYYPKINKMKGFTIDIKVEDSSQETIYVDPVVNEDEVLIGVYKLYKSPPDQFNYLGDIAFHQEHGDWEYCGDILNIEEQEQVAEGIQYNKQ